MDPGYSGSIALLTTTGELTVHDMPVVPGSKGKNELNLHQLATLLAPRDTDPVVAIIEKVSAMPNQGVSSTFRFGEGYGALQAMLVGHGYPLHYVTPSNWKKHFGLTSDKGTSRGLASKRFPQSAHLFARVKDDGRAEAALIALYGMETIRQFATA